MGWGGRRSLREAPLPLRLLSPPAPPPIFWGLLRPRAPRRVLTQLSRSWHGGGERTERSLRGPLAQFLPPTTQAELGAKKEGVAHRVASRYRAPACLLPRKRPQESPGGAAVRSLRPLLPKHNLPYRPPSWGSERATNGLSSACSLGPVIGSLTTAGPPSACESAHSLAHRK